ncbi:MAG: hypothetical protein NWE83_14680 [Candidatus Bathyarchaeota archaeon]|nr:hypothetical protein [Candidatus Bathyarchaeota archaeon]
MLTKKDWNKYHLASPATGVDAILDHIITRARQTTAKTTKKIAKEQ